MRKGMGVIEIVIWLLLGLAVLIVGFNILADGGENARVQIDSLQACSGFVGTLGGKSGYCFPDNGKKDCGNNVVTPADEGYYYQYIGKGWGCEPTEMGIETYCCVQLPKESNPLRATDVNQAKCTSELQPGEWAAQTGLACTKVTQGATVSAGVNEQITFFYKPKEGERQCNVHFSFDINAQHYISTNDVLNKGCYDVRNADGIVAIQTSAVSYMDALFKQYGAGYRLDRSTLNTAVSIPSELRSTTGTLNFQLATEPKGVLYCPLSNSPPQCANQRVGTKGISTPDGECKLIDGGQKCTFEAK